MTTKKPKVRTPAIRASTLEDIAQQAKAKAEAARNVARVATDGTFNIALVKLYMPKVNDGVDLHALVDQLPAQVKAIAAGDLTQLESMLLTQAVALQSMFSDLALRGRDQPHIEWQRMLMSLALKCASGSRQAIVALAELRMPKSVTFAKQANISSGPQQVNNGVAVPTGTTGKQHTAQPASWGAIESLPTPDTAAAWPPLLPTAAEAVNVGSV